MTLDEYQTHVLRTANRGEYPRYVVGDEACHAFDAMTWGLGLTGEAGEIADLLKKGIGHSHGVDEEKLCKELGDVMWYVAALAHAYRIDLNDVAQANVAKLKARYPDGFTVEASKAKADENCSKQPGHTVCEVLCTFHEYVARGCCCP